MDGLKFADNLDFGVDGLSSTMQLENVESSSWEVTQSWLAWLMWMEVYFILTAVVLMFLYALYLRYANRSSVVYCTSKATMKNKTVLITSNPKGIGLEAAQDLAQRGARVILACSYVREAQQTAAKVDTKHQDNHGRITVRRLDTSSIKAITEFADEILKTEKRLDVLMLTANVGGHDTKELTEDDLEVTMATNHFGHFLLVNLLLGLLKSSAPSRIVVMASSAHYLLSSINPKDLNFRSVEYGSMRAYAQSMACNLIMANNLAHLTEHTGVTVNSMCPGMMVSQPYLSGSGIITKLYLALLHIASRSSKEGAQTLIHLAVSEEVGSCTGAFFTDCKEREMTYLGKDNGLAKKTWERCEGMVGLIPGSCK